MAHVVMIEPKSNEGSLLTPEKDPLLSVEDVAGRLNVSRDWVWDHSSRKAPFLPVIRVSEGILRYRASEGVHQRARAPIGPSPQTPVKWTARSFSPLKSRN